MRGLRMSKLTVHGYLIKVRPATPEAGKPKCPTCGGSGDGERYDLVFTSPWAKADFQRVQCKTARMSNGNVKFDIRSSSCGKHADYRGQVEYFGVYYPVNGKCYLVPVKQCGVSSTTLILNRPGDALAAGKYEL